MSSSATFPDDEGPLTYESVGYSTIEVSHSSDGVTLMANADGFRSLAQLFQKMAERSSAGHVHLTPTMQLTAQSQPLAVGRLSTDV